MNQETNNSKNRIEEAANLETVNQGSTATKEETTNNTSNTNKTSRDISNETGIKNLVPFNQLTVDKQREIARAGGKASGETRRKRKEARQLMQEILNRTISDSNIDEILGDSKQLLGEDKTAYNVLLVKMLTTAMQGNTTAMQLVRDTAGDRPADRQEIVADIMTDADRKLIDNVRKRLLG